MGIPVPRILYETKVAKSFGPEMKGNFFGMPKDINTSFYAPDDINEFRTLLPNVDRRAYPKDKSEVKSKSGLKSLFSSSSTPEAAQIPRTDTNGAHSGADARVQDSNQASPSAPNDLQQLSDQVVPSVEEKITSWPFRSGRTNITTTKHTHPPRNIQREGSESDNSSLYSSTLFGTPFLKSGYSQGRDSGYGTQPSARATPANDSQLTASTDSEMDAGDTDLVERKKVPLKPRLQLQDETPRRSSRITALRGEAGVSQPTSSSLGKRTRTSTDEDSCKRSKNQKSDRVSVVTDLRRLREFLFKKVKLIALEDETHSAIPRQLHVPFAEYYIPM